MVADLGKLSLGQEPYYTEQLARSHEEYLSGHGEAPGVWRATVPDSPLQAGDRVSTEQFSRACFQAADPLTGELLGAPHGKNALPAYDLVLRPPKSVALVWAFGDERTRAVFDRAQDEAVQVAVDYVTRHIGARRGRGGREHVEGSGVWIAGFRHRTSRANDPLPHEHLVIGNRVLGPDGRWTAIDGRDLYAIRLAVDAVYSSHLEHLLKRELGVRFTPADEHGIREVEGISAESIRAFSKRHTQIEQACEAKLEQKRAEGGREQLSVREVRAEVRKTRAAKEYIEMETLHDRWRAEAAERGLPVEAEVRAALGHQRSLPPTLGEIEQSFEQLASPQGLTAQASTFTRHDVVRGLRRELAGVGGRGLEELAEAFLGSGRVVSVTGLDARLARWTTPEVCQVEQQLIDRAQARAGEQVAIVPPKLLRETLAEYPALGGDQRAMVEDLTRGGRGVAVVVGRAGTGKTYALDAARAAWELAGVRIVGAGPTGIAADELEAGANIADTRTVDSLLLSVDRDPARRAQLRAGLRRLERQLGATSDPKAQAELAETIAARRRSLELDPLPRGGVLVVDEAGMVGTRKLLALAEHAERAGCKLVLVGDDKQLQSIDMGGGFRVLRQRLGASELTVNRRQRTSLPDEAISLIAAGEVEQAVARFGLDERTVELLQAGKVDQARAQHTLDARAVELLRAGRGDDALGLYEAGGRVTVAKTRPGLEEAMLADWWQAHQAGEQVVMLTQQRADADTLNDRARQVMHAAGRLGNDQLTIRGRAFAVGDLVVARRNERRPTLHVSNGTRGTITAIDPQGRSLTMRTGRGASVTLPGWYLAKDGAGGASLNHAYATTGHKSQGITVDRALARVGAALSMEWAYTALTRVRRSAHLYAVARQDAHPELDIPAAPHRDPHEQLAAGMTRSEAQLAAIDTHEPTAVHALTVAQLRAERDQLIDRLGLASTAAGGGRRSNPIHQARIAQGRRDRAEQIARAAADDARRAQARADAYVGLRTITHPSQARQARADAEHARARALAARQHADHGLDALVAARQGHAQHAGWTERSAADRHRLVEVTRELGWRKHAARAALALEQPAWAVGLLGRYPAAGTSRQRRDWQTAADAIRTYRDTYNIHDPDSARALGDRPRDLRQRAAWQRINQTIDRVRERQTPERAGHGHDARHGWTARAGGLERDTG